MKKKEVNIGFRYSAWRHMAMHSNKDMNHKPCFFLMKKIQSKKNIGRLEETTVFVGLSEII